MNISWIMMISARVVRVWKRIRLILWQLFRTTNVGAYELWNRTRTKLHQLAYMDYTLCIYNNTYIISERFSIKEHSGRIEQNNLLLQLKV